MQLESRIHDHRHPNGVLSQAVSTAQGVAHAATSIAKTQVLRRDRVTSEALEARLAVCRDCPGGHATFKKSGGELHTCGPMLESLRKAGEKTCGCVLRLKAVDAKEACPYGYWPTLEPEQIVRGEAPQAIPVAAATAQHSVPGLITADKTLVSPRQGRGKASSCSKRRAGGVRAYSETEMRALVRRREAERRTRPFDPSRRRFIGSAAAAGASALVFAPKVWANDPTKYLAVSTSCGTSGSYTHVPYYEGWKENDIVKADDDNCYEVTGCVVEPSPPAGLAPSASGAICADCGDPLTCLGDCADSDPQPDAVVAGLTGSCASLNDTYEWTSFSDNPTNCAWGWNKDGPGVGPSLRITLTKATGNITVNLGTGGALNTDAGSLLTCVGGNVNGSVSLSGGYCASTGTASFNGA